MNRYLFRGKRLDNGEWVEGDKLGDLIGTIELAEYDSSSVGCGVEDRGCNDRYEGAEYGYELALEDAFQSMWQVDPATIGQCTGLKDKNGKLIFEGDFIKGKKPVVHVVEWDLRECQFIARYDKYGTCSINQQWIDCYEKEIMGSIYEK